MKKKFLARASATGFDFGSDKRRSDFLKYLKENPRMRFEIVPILPESPKQRAFYHGAVIPLWIFLDGNDYKDYKLMDQYHEVAKREFNGEIVTVSGKPQKVGKSTKNVLNDGFLERVIDYLVENYAIDQSIVLDPALYKKYRDEIYPFAEEEYESFIDYMLSTGLLKR